MKEQQRQKTICLGDFNIPCTDKDISPVQPWGVIDFSKLRENFQTFLKNTDFQDPGSVRHSFTWYPNPVAVHQMRQEGMRVDYILIPKDVSCSPLNTQSHIRGSDHKPISIQVYEKDIERLPLPGPFDFVAQYNSIDQGVVNIPPSRVEPIFNSLLEELKQVDFEDSDLQPQFMALGPEDRNGRLKLSSSIFVSLTVKLPKGEFSDPFRVMIDTGST